MLPCKEKDKAIQNNLPKYFTGKPCKHGHISERYTNSSCCCACASENSWMRNKGDAEFIAKRQQSFKKHYKKNRANILRKATEWERANPERKMLAAAKFRAKQKGLMFDLTLDDIQLPTVCPVLGISLKVSGHKRNDNSATLDRIDSSKGYTKDNIIIVSWKANRIKNNATIEELQKISEFYTNLQISSPFSREWQSSVHA